MLNLEKKQQTRINQEILYKERMMEEKVYDICYKCGKSDDNLTMNELNESDFDIYCDDCFEGEE
jgi:uncharacterized metal-binding protein